MYLFAFMDNNIKAAVNYKIMNILFVQYGIIPAFT
jgi:hypothetical protein